MTSQVIHEKPKLESSQPTFTGKYKTILLKKTSTSLRNLFNNDHLAKTNATNSARSKSPPKKKQVFIFNTRAKRFPNQVDELFERRYSNPGPGQYDSIHWSVR